MAGKKRKVRRAAVKAVFLPTRQAACRACPLIRTPGDVRGETNDAARMRASVPDAQQPTRTSDRHRYRRRRPQAGSVLPHRARSTGTGDGPWHKRRRSSTEKKRPLSTRLRKTLRRNWGARVSSACSARLSARYGRCRAVPRRCGWITAYTTGKQSVRKDKGQAKKGKGSDYSDLFTRAAGTVRNALKAAATLARKPLLKLPSSSAFGS